MRGEDFVAVAHVHVEHVGVFVGDQAFDTERQLRGIEGQQNMHVLVEARARSPRVPLIDRRYEALRNTMGNGTLDVVDDEPGRQRRPVIYAERTAADKLFEPFPARIPVVVGGYVEL